MVTFLRKKSCMVLFLLLCIGNLFAQNPNPVKNLNGSCNNNGKIALSWGEPDLNGFWLTYSSDNVLGSIGIGQEGEVRSAARFTASDMTEKGVTAGDKIAMIQFYFTKAGCSDLKLQVYDGGMMIPFINMLVSGTLRVEQPIDMPTIIDGWNTVHLKSPHTINTSSELWFGYSVYASADAYSLSYDYGPSVENKSDLIWTMSSLGIGLWSTLYAATQNEYTLNACIKAFVTKNDVVPLERYDVYKDGVKIGETTSRNYTANDIEPGAYNFCVVAVYNDGYQSQEACKLITCNEVCDPVKALAVEYLDNCSKAVISWNAPGNYAFPLRYNVYRDEDLIAPQIDETAYLDDTFDFTKEHTWRVETVCPTLVSNKVNANKPACGVGVNEYLKNLSIYPNPAHQTVTIQVDKFKKIEIYNIFGQLLEESSNNNVNVANYSAGIYFFKVFDLENNFANRRITVTR